MVTLLIVLPFYFILSIINTRKSRKGVWLLTLIWSRFWLRATGMPVQCKDRIADTSKTYIIVSNHISYLDPIVIYDVLPFYFRPLAKHDVAKVPLFGFIYSQIALLVDRSNAKSRADSMQKMLETVQSESSIFIYPEGTFNETGQPLKSFYNGAFRLAIEAQKPILPIIFPDTAQRWDNQTWWKMWPGRNRAFILEPIEVVNLQLSDVEELKNKTMSQMEKAIIKASLK